MRRRDIENEAEGNFKTVYTEWPITKKTLKENKKAGASLIYESMESHIQFHSKR